MRSRRPGRSGRCQASFTTASAREILDGPDLARRCREESARHLRRRGARHVDEMAVLLKAIAFTRLHRRWSLVPHLLQAQRDDLVGGTVSGALVLRATRLADPVARPGVRHTLAGVVLGHLIGARFPIEPSFQRGQARALDAELIDAIDAVLMNVAGARWRIQLASEVRHTTSRAPVRGHSAAPGARATRRRRAGTTTTATASAAARAGSAAGFAATNSATDSAPADSAPVDSTPAHSTARRSTDVAATVVARAAASPASHGRAKRAAARPGSAAAAATVRRCSRAPAIGRSSGEPAVRAPTRLGVVNRGMFDLASATECDREREGDHPQSIVAHFRSLPDRGTRSIVA